MNQDTADEIEVGDRVRVDVLEWGTVEKIDPDSSWPYAVRFDDGDLIASIPASHIIEHRKATNA